MRDAGPIPIAMPELRLTTVRRLRERLLAVRVGFYVTMLLTSAAVAAAGAGDGRVVALIPIAAAAIVVTRVPMPLVRKVELMLWTDAVVAAAVWWLFGPVIGVDFVLFYIVAISAIVLDRAGAIRALIAAVTSELTQIPLHIVATTGSLPLFHPVPQVLGLGEFAAGVGLRVLAIVLMAALFHAVAEIIRRAEIARRRSEDRFRRLYQGAPVAYVTAGGDGRIAQANDAARSLLATAGGQPDHLRLVDVFGRIGDADPVSVLERAYAGEAIRNEELPLAVAFGADRWVTVSADPVLTSDGDVTEVRVALVDATDARRARVTEAQARDQLQELVSSKDRFIASISHEVRTPLAGIVGFAELLAEDWNAHEDGERRELAGVIADQSQELSFLIEDFLVASRLELDELTVLDEPVDLASEVRAVIEGSGAVVRGGRTIVVEEPAGASLARGDRRRIHQLVRILVTNAIQHGGDTIRVVISDDRTCARLDVRDNGAGVPGAVADALFERYRVFNSPTGVTDSIGLGLYVAGGLARRMGGRLTYRREGTESVFGLRLRHGAGEDRTAA